MTTSSLARKVWNFCHTLRDDGVSSGDYLEQLTYFLFLKMAHEYAQETFPGVRPSPPSTTQAPGIAGASIRWGWN
jgi:type I restriction enzyme M protein